MKSAFSLPPLGPWHDGAEPPAEPGVYRRRGRQGPYACWDGARWRTGAPTAAAAAEQSRVEPAPAGPWRGLLAPASTPCATCRGHTVLDRGLDPVSGDDVIEECPDC